MRTQADSAALRLRGVNYTIPHAHVHMMLPGRKLARARSFVREHVGVRNEGETIACFTGRSREISFALCAMPNPRISAFVWFGRLTRDTKVYLLIAGQCQPYLCCIFNCKKKLVKLSQSQRDLLCIQSYEVLDIAFFNLNAMYIHFAMQRWHVVAISS